MDYSKDNNINNGNDDDDVDDNNKLPLAIPSYVPGPEINPVNGDFLVSASSISVDHISAF